MLIKSIVNDLCRPLCTDIFGAVASWTTPIDIPAAEAAALKAFYDATGGTGWTNNTGWGTTATAADWFGVTVTAGHVTATSLPSNNLTGAAGTTLDPLAATLVTLDLGGNSVTGIDISALTALTTIDISDCTLSQAEVDAALLMLDTAGAYSGTLTISGNNAAPSANGLAYATSLEAKGWTVTTAGTLALAETLTAGTLKIATVDGGAMMFRAGADYSGYAGTDAGSTPYLLELGDSAGAVAYAWIGAAGAGETLGTEIVTNGNMETGDPPTGWVGFQSTLTKASVERTGGAGTYSVAISRDTANSACEQSVTLTIGNLYKFYAWAKKNDGGTTFASVVWASSYGERMAGILPVNLNNTWVNIVQTFTSTAASAKALYNVAGSTTGGNLDDVSLKQLTDVPATGLHLMSGNNGTTRNMGYVETGFNPNTVTRLRIYAVP